MKSKKYLPNYKDPFEYISVAKEDLSAYLDYLHPSNKESWLKCHNDYIVEPGAEFVSLTFAITSNSDVRVVEIVDYKTTILISAFTPEKGISATMRLSPEAAYALNTLLATLKFPTTKD